MSELNRQAEALLLSRIARDLTSLAFWNNGIRGSVERIAHGANGKAVAELSNRLTATEVEVREAVERLEQARRSLISQQGMAIAQDLDSLVYKKIGPGAIRDQLYALCNVKRNRKAAAKQLLLEIDEFNKYLSGLHEAVRPKTVSTAENHTDAAQLTAGTADNTPPPTRKPHPDIVDVFIILLLAASLDIFVFWMATQFVANPVFQKLPDFVTGAYSGIWTSVATGTAGVGLVIVKAIGDRTRPSPNYFIYVIATAGALIVAIVGLAVISFVVDRTDLRPPKPTPLFGAFLLDLPADGTSQIFDLRSETSMWVYTYKGKISLKDRTVAGDLETSIFETTALFTPAFPMEITRVEVNTCHWRYLNGIWSVDWSPQRANVNNSVEVGTKLETAATFHLPAFRFSVAVPQDADLKETWLCFRLDNQGGYFPAPH